MRYKEKIAITNSSEETRRLGEEFARSHLARLITLYGDLGSGKTTFVQGMAKGFGIKRRIISPTFIIVRSYELESQKSIQRQAQDKSQKYNSKFKSFGQRTFFHVDLYRVKSEQDIEGLGLEEIIKDSQNIVAIEWAEKMGRFLPKKRWDVKFEYLGGDRRRISIYSVLPNGFVIASVAKQSLEIATATS